MASKTSNFGLIKPELMDTADITAFNENWDKIDEQLLKAGESGGSDLVQTELGNEIEGEEPVLDPTVEQAVTEIVTEVVTPIVDNTLKPHIENKENPHNVTAKQVGALTSSDIVDNLESTATNLPASARTVHELNKNMVKYNAETDMLDVYFNGELVGSLLCLFKEAYLYNYGDKCVNLTGGWSTNTLGSNIPANMSPYLNEQADCMVFGSNNSATQYSGYATLNTVVPIDLTNYKTLEIKLSGLNTQFCDIHVSKKLGRVDYEAITNVNVGVYSLDVSSFNGNYYIGVSITVALQKNQSVTIDYIKLY